jgi:hypothetical protein
MLNGDRVCVADWVVDLNVCVEDTSGYTKLTSEQRRRVDVTFETLGTTAGATADFGTVWQAEFNERPPESISKLVEACIGNIDPSPPDGRPGAVAITATGSVFLVIATVGVGMLAAGAAIADKAESDFEKGPTVEDRLDANRDGERGQTIAVIGGVTAASLLPAGISLLIVGRHRAKSHVAVVPSVSPRFAGLLLTGRF